MHYFRTYLRELPFAKQTLWCYLIWYLVMVALHFEPAPRLWLTSLGISVVIGIGLILSVSGNGKPDVWTKARLFLMPFCVSSFSALIKEHGFVLIFSPLWREDLLALGACASFVLVCHGLRHAVVATSAPTQQRVAKHRAQRSRQQHAQRVPRGYE